MPKKVTIDSNLTLEKLVTNPSGKGSASIFSRKAIIRDLDLRFLKLFQDKEKFSIFKATFYKKRTGELVCHVTVPTERITKKKFYYDVVFEWKLPPTPPESLKNLRVKVFTNSPNFVYTYAYLLNKNDSLPKDFIYPKSNIIPKKTLQQPPIMKNPYGEIGFEKTIYFHQ